MKIRIVNNIDVWEYFVRVMRKMMQRKRVSQSLAGLKRRRMFLGRTALRARGRLSALARKPEVKDFLVGITTKTPFAGSNQFMLMNGIQQGAANGQRVGNKINLVRLHIRAAVVTTGAFDVTFPIARMLVVYDKQTNAAALASTQLLETDDAFSTRNVKNLRRLDILYDKSFGPGDLNIVNVSGGATYFGGRMLDVYIPLKNRVTEYNDGNAGTVADIQTGSLYVCLYSSGSDNTHGYTFRITTELKYTDA